MRTFVALLAVAGLLATGAAQARGGPAVSLSVSSFKVLYGNPLTVSGRVSSGRAGEHVSLYRRPFGSQSWHRVRTITTTAGGRWSFKAGPSIETSYQARWRTTSSRKLTVGVLPRLTAVENGSGRIRAQVQPAGRFRGSLIQLQRPAGHGMWRTIAKAPVRAASAAVFAPMGFTGSARLALSVNEAGKGYLGSTSHPFRYRAYAVTLVPQSLTVLYGNSVLLAGRIQNGNVGDAVTIDAWPYGHSAPIHVATVTTGIGGNWRLGVKPSIETSYQAHLGSMQSSVRMTVGVMPAVTARELPSGKIAAQVTAGRSFRGRQVKLQQRSSGVWRTVAQQPLGRGSQTTFAVPLATSTVRVAFSVNEAGKGYLGSTSHLLAYHGHGLALTVSAYKVLYGNPLTISGRVSTHRAGARVVITAWPYGKSAPHRVVTVTTRAGGRFSVKVKPGIETAYSATSGLSASKRFVVGVEPALTIREEANGNVWAHVSAARTLRGRMLQLQLLGPGNGGWHTIQQKPLDRSSTAVFTAPAALTTKVLLRAALSVNEAGPGLLGSLSHVLAFRAT